MPERTKPLKLLSKEIFSGVPLYSTEKMEERADGLPLVNIKDVAEGTIRPDTYRRLMPGEFKNLSRYLIYPKDVVVTCRGSLLKAAVITEDIGKALITSNLIAIRLGELVLPEFLAIYLNIKEGQRKILKRATSADTRLVLTVSNVEELEVPVLPINLQKQIIDLTTSSVEQYRLSLGAAVTRKKITERIIEELIKK